MCNHDIATSIPVAVEYDATDLTEDIMRLIYCRLSATGRTFGSDAVEDLVKIIVSNAVETVWKDKTT